MFIWIRITYAIFKQVYQKTIVLYSINMCQVRASVSSHLTVLILIFFVSFFLTNADRSYLWVFKPLSLCSDGWTLVSCLFPLHWVVLSAFSQPLSPALSLPLPFNSHLLLSHPVVLDRMSQGPGCLNQLEFSKDPEEELVFHLEKC